MASIIDIRKIQDIYALAIYGLVIFPKTLGYVEAMVAYFFSRLCHNINPTLAIIVETIRACAPLFHIWLIITLSLKKVGHRIASYPTLALSLRY